MFKSESPLRGGNLTKGNLRFSYLVRYPGSFFPSHVVHISYTFEFPFRINRGGEGPFDHYTKSSRIPIKKVYYLVKTPNIKPTVERASAEL